ncbi:MAG: hypothetical protein HS113_15995 [Verrucomicrobiales bacterium]|nr:hypothetical protein [Verrucomicrobiales bacterium]
MTSDSAILDRCQRWINLTRAVISRSLPQAWIVDLAPDTATAPRPSP